MAIDKNFVIKNGLEVNTNVLVAAADEKQVGIGTTRPYYKLHVGGGEGSRGGIGATDITISGIATLGVGNSSQGALKVVGISTFDGDIDLLGSAGVSTVLWDASENRLEFKDNASVGFGTGNDLTLWHDGSISYIKDTVGDLRIAGDKITLELEDGTDVKVIDQFGVNITGVTTTNRLYVSGISTFMDDVDFDSQVRFDESEKALTFVDGAAIRVGTGSDFSIIHNGSDTILRESGTGDLKVFSSNFDVRNAAGTEIMMEATEDASVDLYFNGTKRLTTTAIGATVFGDLVVAGVTTAEALNVTGIATVGTALSMNDNVKAQFGTDGDLIIYANSTDSEIKDTSGRLSLVSNQVYLELESGTNILKGDQFGVIVTGVTTTNRLYVSGISTFADTVNVSTGATITSTGNAAFAGIVTANGGVNVGTAVTIDAETGNVAVSGIMTVGGNLYVTGDITYDEVTGRNLNITGVTTFGGLVNVDAGITANTAIIEDLTDNRVVIAGSGGELEDSGNLTFDGTTLAVTGKETVSVDITVGSGVTIQGHGGVSIAGIVTANGGVKVGTAVSIHTNGNLGVTGILTAKEFVGVFTSAGGAGIGIGSTTAHVGYGITYIDFKGPGVSTVYSSSVTGITTIYFQGGGGSGVGAAGTWQNDGSQGISTAKSVGINTVGVAVTALMGGVKGASSGIGASMQGLYIGNGMMINDNQLNGNHYIGTAFGGIMAGPVTVNGVVTVDGNWAVV